MRTLHKILSTAAMLSLAAGISNAGSVSYTSTQGPALTDFLINLSVPKFDSSMGTLTGATIRFTSTDDIASLTLTNSSPSNQTFRYRSVADFFITGNTADSTLVGTDLSVPNFDSGFITLGPNGASVCPAATPSSACNSVSYTPASASVNTGDLAVNSLASYIASLGDTDFLLSGFTSTSTTFNGGGGF